MPKKYKSRKNRKYKSRKNRKYKSRKNRKYKKRSRRKMATSDSNIFNEKLKICSTKPMTGFTRNGYCNYIPGDGGKHLVCVTMNKKFLEKEKKLGNDLSSVVDPGQNWCICNGVYKRNKEFIEDNNMLVEDATNILSGVTR